MIIKSKTFFSNKVKNKNKIIIYIITNEVIFQIMLFLLIKLSFIYAKFRKIREKKIIQFVKERNIINANMTKSLMQNQTPNQ